MFNSQKKYIVGAPETVPYTAEVLTDNDFDVEPRELTYDKTIAIFQRKVMDGTLDSAKGVVGIQSGTSNFTIDMSGGKTEGTPPPFDKFMGSCGFKREVKTISSPTLDVESILFLSVGLVTYTYAGTPDLSAVIAGELIVVSGAAFAGHNGEFIIDSVDDGADSMVLRIPAIIDNTDDVVSASTATGLVATGFVYTLHRDYTCMPMTLEAIELDCSIDPKQLLTRIFGAVGNLTLALGNIGEPVLMNFEFMGALDTIEEREFASFLNRSSLVDVDLCPPGFLSAQLDVGSTVQNFNTFELGVGNTLNPWNDHSKSQGRRGFYVGARESVFTIDPLAQLFTGAEADDYYTKWKGAVLENLNINFLTAAPAISITAPKIQLEEVGTGDRENATTNEKSYRLLRGPVGNDSLAINIGTVV